MQNCPVSVVIPIYNREGFIPGLMDSILSQSCRPGEIIMVDDGSTDNTREGIISLQGDCHVSLRYLHQENRGPAAARNLGITHAAYGYIAFLDSDDLWHPKKLERQYGLMLQYPQYQISHTSEKWLRDGKHLNQKKKHLPRHGNIFGQCLELCAVGMSTVMVKKDLFSRIGLFDETFPCCEDYEMWLRVSAVEPFLLLDDRLTIKQGGRDDQLSWQYRVGMDRFRIQALEKLLTGVSLNRNQKKAVIKELVKKLTIYGNGCVRHDRRVEGQECLHRAGQLQQILTESTV